MNIEYKVSLFKKINQPNECENILVDDFLNDVQSEKYKLEINNIRACTDIGNKNQAGELKKKLPACTPSGIFKHRSEKGLIKHSGLLCIDFDTLPDPVQAKAQISKEKWVFAAFISPSGKGLKVFIKIDPTEHKAAFLSLQEYFKQAYTFEVDKACKDVSRLCFISSDKDIYINKNCETCKAIENKNRDRNNQQIKNVPSSKEVEQLQSDVEIITQRIEGANIDIATTYEDWLKLGFALASGLGEAGREYFLRLSNLYAGEQKQSPDKQFDECLKERKQGVNIQSFFHLAKDAGIDIRVNNKTKPTNSQKQNDIKQFWTEKFTTTPDGIKQYKGFEIDKLNFLNLLYSFGYRRFDFKGGFSFVKVKDNIIQEVQLQHIQDAFLDYLKAMPNEITKRISKDDLQRKILNNLETLFGKTLLSTLRNDRDFEFNTDTKSESFVYYQNGFVKCVAGSYSFHPYTELKKAIWQERIIKRDFKKYDIDEGLKSNYEKFIFNVCDKNTERLHSLMSIIGYLLHDFTENKLKAVVLTDSKISDENDGRTGKTLFGKALRHIRNVCEISGKDFRPDNKFKYQDCQLSTQVLFLNDIKNYFNLENLYTDITEGITIEKKNQSPIQLKLKYLITTNKPLKTKGASSKDRVIEFEFSDHYNENFSPQNEFKQWFFGVDWNLNEWQKFDNFMMLCISLYLENGIIEVNPVNLMKRKFINQTSKEFYDFVMSGEILTNREFSLSKITEAFKENYPEYDFYKASENRTIGKWLKEIPVYLEDFRGLEKKETRKVQGERFYIFSN